jgi:hypothetical protein
MLPGYRQRVRSPAPTSNPTAAQGWTRLQCPATGSACALLRLLQTQPQHRQGWTLASYGLAIGYWWWSLITTRQANTVSPAASMQCRTQNTVSVLRRLGKSRFPTWRVETCCPSADPMQWRTSCSACSSPCSQQVGISFFPAREADYLIRRTH